MAAGHRRRRHRRPRGARTGCPAAVVDGNDLWAVARGGARGGRARPRRRRPDAARVPHLPPLRPLEVRPGEVPARRRGRALAGARPAARIARERLLARRRRRRTRSPRSSAEITRAARQRRRERAGRAVPRPARRARDGVRGMSERLEFRARDPRRDRRGARARRARRLLRRGRRAARRRLQGHAAACSERFGPDRVFDTPISELALAGAAFGAAVTGLRPVFEIMFGDFMALPMDSLVNQSAKFWYISNEQGTVPLVVRSAVGAGGRFGAIHSQIHATWFQGVPGLKIVFPSTPAEAKGLLKGVDPRRQPGHLPRAQAAVLGEGPGARGRRRRIPLGAGERRARRRRRHDRLGRQGRRRRARRRREARRGRHRRRGRRPAHAAPARRRDGARVGREDEPARSPSRRARAPAAGRPACSARSPRRACTTSTTPGSSRPTRRPCPTRPTLEDAFLPDADAIVASVRERLGAAVS